MYLFDCILWLLQAYRKTPALFYKNEPEFLVIRGKAGITVTSLQLSLCSIFYLWPLYKHVIPTEKLLPSGENLFILWWRLRFVSLAVLVGHEGWRGGRGALGTWESAQSPCFRSGWFKEPNMLISYFPISFLFLTSLWAPLISLYSWSAPAELNRSQAQGWGGRELSPGWNCSSALV